MKNNNGFTLVELMVVVAILGILVGIAIPSYNGYIQRSARATVKADLQEYAQRMERRKGQIFSYKGATVGPATSDTFSALSPRDATAANRKYDITLIELNSARTVLTGTQAMAGYEIQAVSTSNFDSNQTEALKINDLGKKCIKALAAGVTTCAIEGASPDPSW